MERKYVFHYTHGICEVTEDVMMTLEGGKEKEYILLCPLFIKGSTIHVPKGTLSQRTRDIISPKQAKDYLEKLDTLESEWSSNYRIRITQYNEAIAKNDPLSCLEVLAHLSDSWRNLESKKRKGEIESKLYNKILTLVIDEFSTVLETEKNEMKTLILDKLKNRQVNRSENNC